MLNTRLLSLLAIIIASCHASHPAPADTRDTAGVDDAVSSAMAKSSRGDTTAISGNFILFLRPVADPEGEEVEDDSDFAVGIVNTDDSIKKNIKYRDIHVEISTARYIFIKDCKDGPLVIDRDTVNYGVILSGTGKPVSTTYNNVHSGDYLGEVNDYFSLE